MSSPVLSFPAPAKAPKRIKSAQSIRGLKAPKTGVAEYSVEDTPGLSLRVTSNNVRLWRFRYSNPQARMRALEMGSLTDISLSKAREMVKGYRDMLADERDPANHRAEVRDAITFEELVAGPKGWIEVHAKRKLKSDGEEELRILNSDFNDWKLRAANDITKADVLDLMDRKEAEGHPSMALHLKKFISRVYRWGLSRDLVTVNPVVAIKSDGTPDGRERVLAVDEVLRIWKAADTQPPHPAAWFRLRLVLGKRGSELLTMRRQDVDFATGWWTIPKEFAKNNITHMVYLNEIAIEILQALPNLDPVWMFPCGPKVKESGKNKGKLSKGVNTSKLNVMGDYKKFARRIAQPSRANVIDETAPEHKQKGRKTAGFQGRDLRRTMTTILASLDVRDELLKKLLNHEKEEKSNVTAIYNRFKYNPQKKQIWDLWARQLRRILAGQPIDESDRYVETTANAPQSGVLVAMNAIIAAEADRLSPGARAGLEALMKMGARG
jgi:integrase